MLGNSGFLGPTREPDYGGLGLDYSYSVAIAEELGSIRCGGVPMAIGVQTGTNVKLCMCVCGGGDEWWELIIFANTSLIG